MYVDIKDKDKRKTFLYFLEGKEYESYHFTRKYIIDSKMPFDVNIDEKKFTVLESNNIEKKDLIEIEEAIKVIDSKR